MKRDIFSACLILFFMLLATLVVLDTAYSHHLALQEPEKDHTRSCHVCKRGH